MQKPYIYFFKYEESLTFSGISENVLALADKKLSFRILQPEFNYNTVH